MPKQNATILCIGSDALGLEVRRLVLESFGYTAFVKPDCSAAQVVLSLRNFDLVVLDFQDLRESQVECIRTLRQQLPRQRIMLLAPLPYVDPKIAAMVDCILTKGASPEEFRSALEECLGSKGTGSKLARVISLAGAFVGIASELVRHRAFANVTAIDRARRNASKDDPIIANLQIRNR